MNTAKNQRRQADLAKIHIAKKQLGIDDETYRAMLFMVAGVDSAGALDAKGRVDVLRHLRKAGFVSKGNRRSRFPGRPNMKALVGTGKEAMVRKIEAYLAEAKRPWSYAHSMAKRMSEKHVARIEWCEPEDLRSIIVALEMDARRHGRFTG